MIIEQGESVYLYDGTFDGLLSAIFQIYYEHANPANIAPEENFQQGFGQIIRSIKTDEIKSKRVADGFKKKCGYKAFDNIVTAFLSSDIEKSYKIYKYMKTGFSYGQKSLIEIVRDEVLAIEKICTNIGKESHVITGFVRFTLMENNIFYSQIEPTNNVIPIIMPFFADRYSDQLFIIHAPNHKMAGYYDLDQWRLVQVEEINLPAVHSDQVKYDKMWKRFYETIAIDGRENYICKRSHMPLKYWKNLTEMKFDNGDSRYMIE